MYAATYCHERLDTNRMRTELKLSRAQGKNTQAHIQAQMQRINAIKSIPAPATVLTHQLHKNMDTETRAGVRLLKQQLVDNSQCRSDNYFCHCETFTM